MGSREESVSQRFRERERDPLRNSKMTTHLAQQYALQNVDLCKVFENVTSRNHDHFVTVKYRSKSVSQNPLISIAADTCVYIS